MGGYSRLWGGSFAAPSVLSLVFSDDAPFLACTFYWVAFSCLVSGAMFFSFCKDGFNGAP